jgi:hypothetical protein
VHSKYVDLRLTINTGEIKGRTSDSGRLREGRKSLEDFTTEVTDIRGLFIERHFSGYNIRPSAPLTVAPVIVLAYD